MKLTIRNFGPVAQADITLNPIALICGKNEAGKSRTSLALAACLTGEAVPIPGVKKNQAGVLVRSGTAAATAELHGPNGLTRINWPAGKVATEGTAPWSSSFAAGMQSIVNMDEKDRVKTLTEYLKGTPTVEDFNKAVENINLTPAARQQIWERIQQMGWDGCLKHYENQRATLKGQWLEVTGEPYGCKKAEAWLPPGWEYNLESNSKDTLAAIVTDARDALEAALKTDAVDDSKREGLQALVALKHERSVALLQAENEKPDPALAAQLEECNGHIKHMSEKRGELQAQIKLLQAPKEAAKIIPCPKCGAGLHISGLGNIILAKETKQEDNSAARSDLETKIASVNSAIMDHMAAKSKLESRNREADTAYGVKLAEARRLVTEAESAEAELKTMEAAPAKGGTSVDDCRTALLQAETRLKAFRQKTTADARHRSICTMETLIGKIAPDGIRGEVLQRALKGFNQAMKQFTAVASWRDVELGADFLPTYGGCIYLLLSASAQFRVRVVLQLAMAKLDNSQAVVIDAADILDRGGRSGLFKAVQATGLPAMVCVTVDDKEKVPDLKGRGMGLSYWIGDGGVVEGIN